jgi:bifunctional UDP-N-acetylglucosamine pyrophosphorylase/glucosamine-1-phosphate N-acetyltransferase
VAKPRASRPLAAVVLAAGKGKRLKSDLPKVLHPVAGRPAIWHVLQAARAARPDRIVIVVGSGKERVTAVVRDFGIRPEPLFVEQRELLGTGHAVMAAEEAVGAVDDVLVLPGDEPLVTGEQVRGLVRLLRRRDAAAVIQTTVAADPRGFARVIRIGDEFVRLAEGSDATPAELLIGEVATAVYAFRREDLYRALPRVDRENRQKEYYLPDVPGILKEKGERVVVQLADNGGAVGVNSRAEMAFADAVLRARINEDLMERGVTIVDPRTTFIDAGVRIGRDAVIRPMTFLEGDTRIGAGAEIGPSSRLIDTEVGAGATVQFSVTREARIGPRAQVGPYAHIRPGTVLAEGVKAGSFVEIKQSKVGKGSKVPHLTYVGDATIGDDANLGAGTVTVNYDGFDKHRTVIGDQARVGSDTMLVAPVKVGKGAYTGAGSTITRDVPPGALALERGEQVVVEGYAKRKAARARARRKGSAKGKGRGGGRTSA